MLSFLRRIWMYVRKALSFLAPFGSKAKSPAVLWTIHIIVVILILVGLYFLGQWLELYRLMRTGNRGIGRFWLPLLVLLVYLLIWIGWWLWKLLSTTEEVVEFPDIEQAWDQAMAELSRAGIDIKEVPLFFVIGRPEAPELNLFQSAGMELVVKQIPTGNAPLHVYATRDAAYVICANTSLVGIYASYLALEGLEEWSGMAAGGEEGQEGTETLVPGADEKKILQQITTDNVIAEGRPGSALARRSKRRMMQLTLPDPRTETERIEENKARLKFLAQLIVRDRDPFCAINGVLVLLPLGATDSDEDAKRTADLCQRELDILQQTFRMRCPLFVIMCDLESNWGFYEFLNRQKPQAKLRRLGQRFPLTGELNGASFRESVGNSVRWLCSQTMREWVYLQFAVEDSVDKHSSTVLVNTRMYCLLDVMHQRQDKLSYFLRNALQPEQEIPGREQNSWFYGGCYFGAMGNEAGREQAFVRGVLDRLTESQEKVCWTEQAVEDEKRDQQVTLIGYVLLGVFWLVAILFFFVF